MHIHTFEKAHHKAFIIMNNEVIGSALMPTGAKALETDGTICHSVMILVLWSVQIKYFFFLPI